MMKKVLAAILAATALVPAAASAQDGGRWQGRNGEGRGGGEARPPRGSGGWQGGGQFRPRDQAPQVQQQQQEPRAQFQPRGDRNDRGGYQGRPGPNEFGGRNRPDRGFDGQPRPSQPQGDPGFRRGPDGDRGQWNGRRPGDDGRRWNGGPGYRPTPGYDGNRGYNGNRGGQWNREWRRDGRYDYGGYRQSNRYAYRLPRYYAPGGWGYGYRRFGIGFSLSSILFAQDYWLDDPYEYRLPPAYGPYRWVRYYDDALLVDIRSGRVVDAVYGIFW